jgi:hypothetical protein
MKQKQKSRLAANFPIILSKLRVSDARYFAKKNKWTNDATTISSYVVPDPNIPRNLTV